MSKIISINGRKTYTPTNMTAALLLYLLPCDGDDPILLSQFLNLFQVKFPRADVDSVMKFIEKLQKDYKILSLTAGTIGSDDPDPLRIFSPLTKEEKEEWKEEEWETPDLEMGWPPLCKATTIFSVVGGRIPHGPSVEGGRVRIPHEPIFSVVVGRFPH